MVKTTVKIEGMMCGMCESHINDTIRSVFTQASKIRSSHIKGETTFLTGQPVDEAVLKKAIDDTGYHYKGCQSEPYEKHGLFGRR